MSLSLELSVKFGLPLNKALQILAYLEIPDSGEFDGDKEFERICRLISRKRHGSHALAFLSEASDEQRDFVFSLDPNFAKEYREMDFPVMPSEKLSEAKRIIDAISNGTTRAAKNESDQFAEWVKSTIRNAGKEISHSYIAVRILLSLDEKERADYPKIIASLMNKIRHQNCLDGFFRLDEIDGKRTAVYFDPANGFDDSQDDAPADTEWLSPEIVEQARRTLRTDDAAKLAGYIAFQVKRDFNETQKAVVKILSEKTFDL